MWTKQQKENRKCLQHIYMKDRRAVLLTAPCNTAVTKPNQKQEDKMLNRTIRAVDNLKTTQHMYNIIRFITITHMYNIIRFITITYMYNIIRFITITQGYYWKTEVQRKNKQYIYITLSSITFLALLQHSWQALLQAQQRRKTSFK